MVPKNQTFDFTCQNSTLSLEELECKNDTLFKNNSKGLRFEAGTIETDEIIVCCAINFIIETLGNGLLILMIINEKYLMDPQKRTAINQLMTYMCIWLILHNLIGAPLMTFTIYVKDTGKQFLKLPSLKVPKLELLFVSNKKSSKRYSINELEQLRTKKPLSLRLH